MLTKFITVFLSGLCLNGCGYQSELAGGNDNSDTLHQQEQAGQPIEVASDEANPSGSERIGYHEVFAATSKHTISQSFSLEAPKFKTQVNLFSIYDEAVFQMKQVTRPLIKEIFQQGILGERHTRDYSQSYDFPRRRFAIGSIPDSGSIRAWINDKPQTNFYLNYPDVVFYNAPEGGARIVIEYYTGGSARLDFKHSDLIDVTAQTLVKINNQILASGYKFDKTNKKIIFNEFPADGSSIELIARKNDPLRTEHQIPPGYEPGLLAVIQDGTRLNEFSYNKESGILKFKKPPLDGTMVTITARKPLAPVLRYPLQLIGENPRNPVATDLSSKSLMSATFANGALEIDAADFVDGKVIEVEYEADVTNGVIKLPFTPIEESLVVMTKNKKCVVGSDIMLKDGNLVINCDLKKNETVSFSFDYLEIVREFTVPNFKGLEGRWEVKVNGEITTEYNWEGQNIVLRGEPPADSAVEVFFIQD